MQDALDHLAKNDPVLAELIAAHTVTPLVSHSNYYQELVESIIGQQLSVKAARTIRNRFVALFGDEFPTPNDILAKDIDTLKSVGLSRQKAAYIQDLAYKVIEGSVTFDALDSLSNEAIIAELTKIKGVGIWTVHMFLMFCMGRLDVLPTGDLGIRTGVMKLYGYDHLPEPAEIEHVAKANNWHPYASVASLYIWKSLDNMPT